MIPLWTKVRLSAHGKECFRDAYENPHNEVGAVKDNDRLYKGYLMKYEVVWENGQTNAYDESHLEVITDFSQKTLEDYL